MPRYSSFTLEEADSPGGFGLLRPSDLEAKAENTARREDRPSRLPLKEIKVATAVFQPRSAAEDMLQRDQHIRNILHFLNLQPQCDTEPLTVTVVGEEFYLVDGHHRLAAYFAATSPSRSDAPVVYFEGDVTSARKEALRLNSTGKLALLTVERFDNAFELVKLDASEDEVRALTQIGRQTYYTMKKKLREYPATSEMRWAVAKGYTGEKNPAYNPAEPFENQKTHEIEGFLRGILPASSSGIPILANALSHLSPNLPSELISYWLDPKSPGYNKRHRNLTTYALSIENEEE